MKKILSIILLFLLISCASTVIKETSPETIPDSTKTATTPELELMPQQAVSPATEPALESKITQPIKEIKIKQNETPQNYIASYLKYTPKEYVYYTWLNEGGIVSGAKRASPYGVDVLYATNYSEYYWDTDLKKVYIFYDAITKKQIERFRREPVSNPKDTLLIPVYIEEDITKEDPFPSQIDYMKKYQHRTPFKIETNEYVPDLTMYFQEDDGSTTKLDFDTENEILVKITKNKGKAPPYLVISYQSFRPENGLQVMVSLPEKHMIINLEEARRLGNYLEKDRINAVCNNLARFQEHPCTRNTY